MRKFKILSIAGVVVSLLVLQGCTKIVPPAHKGKVLEPSGYTADIYPPGRVSGFGPFSRNQLVLMEVGVKSVKETIKVKLSDNVELTFDVRTRSRIGGSDDVVNSMFNDIVPQTVEGSTTKVSFLQAYNTFGKGVVRNTSRRVMGKYSIQEVSKNFARINAELRSELKERYSGIPLVLQDATLGDVQWPVELTEAVNATMKANAEVAKIEANSLKNIAAAEAAETLAMEELQAEIVRAGTIKQYNAIIAEGMTPEFLQYKAIEMQRQIIEAIKANPGTTTVYMPYDALGTMGAQNQMFGVKVK